MSELTVVAQIESETAPKNLFRVLSLDGGGAKGFYTLGVLKEIEAQIGCRIYQRFDLIFAAVIVRQVCPDSACPRP